jgi:hypothetical protein
MFKHPKVVPITAAKRVSKESLRKETLPPIRTEMVSAWQTDRHSRPIAFLPHFPFDFQDGACL